MKEINLKLLDSREKSSSNYLLLKLPPLSSLRNTLSLQLDLPKTACRATSVSTTYKISQAKAGSSWHNLSTKAGLEINDMSLPSASLSNLKMENMIAGEKEN